MSETPATFPRYLVVGFVGSRRLESADSEHCDTALERLVRERIDTVLINLQQGLAPGESLAAVSALAAGADTIFAEAVAARKISHQVFLPQPPDDFFSPKDFFDRPEVVARSRRLLDSGNVIHINVASDSPNRRERFSECGFEIALECDVLVAVVHDETGKPGGSQETLTYARALGRTTFEITLTGDCPIVETPAKPTKPGATDEEVFGWRLPKSEKVEDALAPVDELKKKASVLSRQEQKLFRYSAAIVLLTHVAATGVAAWVLVGLWGAASLSSAKAILLAVGLGVYLYLHHRHPQRGWVTGRLVAELTRSVLAVRGLPGRLDYLNDFHLPSCRRLLCSFSILHLQSAQRQAMAREAFIAHYLKPVENREGTKGGRIPVQLHYFRKRVQTAKLWRKILGLVFMVSSGLALLTAVLYIGLHWYHVLPEEMSNWQRLIFKLLPVALPMIAAGAASWASMLDLDRRIERYEGLVDFLHYQAEQIRHSASNGILNRLVSQTEHALLQEVVEWHAKHAHVQGH